MIALVGPSIAALAIAWAVLLLAAPFLPIPLAAFLYVFGSFICHQISERSFHVDGAQLQVCARCFGIYAGAAAGAVAATLSRFVPGPDPATGRHRGLTPMAIAAVPTIVTLALEWAGLWSPSNVTRALAAVPLGMAIAFIAVRAIEARPALHLGHVSSK